MTSTLVPLDTLPRDHFPVIYCDPAWRFMTRGKKKHSLPQRSSRAHYRTMLLKDMMALPVRYRATDKAVLLMWTFGAFYKQAIQLGEAWGFKYSTDLFHWEKLSKHGKPRISLGYYSRKQVETVLLFTTKRGGRPVKDHGIRQLQKAPTREHSQKPDHFYDLIEQMFDGPYLELFARQTRPGWSTWGDERFRFGMGGGKMKGLEKLTT
jgi:N6-adenosine-specific RNA methylase IME4